MKQTYTYTQTYALLPDNIEDAVGCIVSLHPNANENTIKVYGKDEYVFLLAERKEYHRNDNDRIRLIPANLIANDEPLLCHALATMVGYEQIKQNFVCYGIADVSQIKI